MKIKKGLFYQEIEFDIDEIKEALIVLPSPILDKFIKWFLEIIKVKKVQKPKIKC